MRAHIAGRGEGVWGVAYIIETRRVVVQLFYWQGKGVYEICRVLFGASAVGRAHCAVKIVRVCCRIFRDAEMARIHNSDYRVRCHRSRGDSGQGEAERTNSAISDSLVDGATLKWEKYRRFEDLSKDKIKAMSLHSYEQYEKESMEKNAWHVCKQVEERIDDVPVLNEYISSMVSESPEELFFFNVSELNMCRNASENSKTEIPGAAYFSKIETFIENHYVRGQLFFEFSRDACKRESSTLCDWCN